MIELNCIACTLSHHSAEVTTLSFLSALKRYPKVTADVLIERLCKRHSDVFASVTQEMDRRDKNEQV